MSHWFQNNEVWPLILVTLQCQKKEIKKKKQLLVCTVQPFGRGGKLLVDQMGCWESAIVLPDHVGHTKLVYQFRNGAFIFFLFLPFSQPIGLPVQLL